MKTIAQLLIKEMKLENAKLNFTGGVDRGRGWKGDVKNILLDTAKLRGPGGKPQLKSTEAIAKTAKQLAAWSQQVRTIHSIPKPHRDS